MGLRQLSAIKPTFSPSPGSAIRVSNIGSRLLLVQATGQQRQRRIGLDLSLGLLAYWVDFKMTATRIVAIVVAGPQGFHGFAVIEVRSHVLQGLTGSIADDAQAADATPPIKLLIC